MWLCSKVLNLNSVEIEEFGIKMSNKEKKKFFFEGFSLFYGLFMGLIIGVLGSFWASITYDYAKTEKSFNLVSSFWIATGCLIAVIIAFIAVSIFFWRKAQKAV
jgi:uncharacterized membrane protein YqgA involved in biofilm formation